jgi:carbonic anhydrase
MAGIHSRSAVIAELETTGAVKIAGAMYSLESGVVDFLAFAPKP